MTVDGPPSLTSSPETGSSKSLSESLPIVDQPIVIIFIIHVNITNSSYIRVNIILSRQVYHQPIFLK